MTTKEALRSLGKAVLGLAVLFAFAFTAIGTVMIVVSNHYWQFAVATVVVLAFAAKPMFKAFQKLLL